LVIDGASAPHAEDAKTLASIEGRPVLIVANKRDLGTAELPFEESVPIMRTSAVTGEGIEQLRKFILQVVTKGVSSPETALVTNLRQRQTVTEALKSIQKARDAVQAAFPHEVLLVDMYDALGALDRLTGATTADDILKLIFSSFCIGK